MEKIRLLTLRGPIVVREYNREDEEGDQWLATEKARKRQYVIHGKIKDKKKKQQQQQIKTQSGGCKQS